MCAAALPGAPAMGPCMRSGDIPGSGGQRGFTYVLLLFVLATAGAGLAALGEQWALAAQREREAELIFRGGQISQALADWRDSSPAAQPAAPPAPRAPLALQELLVDERSASLHQGPRHHLRRLYADPFTGQADWVLLLDAQGRITGVASRSRRPALRRVGVVLRTDADVGRPAVGDWLFLAVAPIAAPASASTRLRP